ncbi:DUF4113 domain-containing protein, partial [Klebsiella pneumoniae]
QMKREMLSPHSTTRWYDIPPAKMARNNGDFTVKFTT